MNFSFSRTRARNIFSPPGTDNQVTTPYRNVKFGTDNIQVGDESSKPQEDSPVKRASKMLMDMYNAPSPATEQYNKYLNEQPDEEKYKPSKKRRLGAILAGFGVGLANPQTGYDVASNIVNDPFDTAIAGWERKRKPLENAAGSEMATRTAKINMLKDYIQAEHTNTMDEANLKNIHDDNVRGDLTLAENKRYHNMTLEELIAEHARTNANRDKDNTRADTTEKETEKQHAWERTHGNDMANIARTNAASTAQRSTAYASSVEGLNAYREHLKAKTANATKPTKQTKELAELNAINIPGNSQRYANFWGQTEQGKVFIKPPVSPDTDELLEWAAFQKAIADEHDKIVKPPSSSKTSEVKTKPKIAIVGRSTVPGNR